MPPLSNPKHEIFAEQYSSGKSAEESALLAGYAKTTARAQMSRLLANVGIQARVTELQAQVAARSQWDATKVLIRLGEQADADILDIQDIDGRFKPLDQWPPIWRKMIQGIDIEEQFERSKDGGGASWDKTGQVVKIKFIDRLKNLELLGKHKAVDAFVKSNEEKHEHLHIHVALESKLVHARLIAAETVNE